MSIEKVYKSSKIVFGDQNFADVRFIFGGESEGIIFAHATVLRIECPELFKTFKSDEQKFGKYSLVISNTKPNIFYIFLELLYGGNSNRAIRFFREIYDLCIEFNTPSIINNLLKQLNDFTSDSVLNVIEAGLHLENDLIINKALKFVANNFSSLLTSEHFLQASLSTVCAILKIDYIPDFTGEHEIVEAMARYIRANSDRKNDTNSFSAAIKLIRFPTMTPREFGQILDNHPNLLTATESVEIFKELNGVRKNRLGFSNKERLDDMQYLEEVPLLNSSQIFINT